MAYYFHGDATEYTGKTQFLYGAMFYEVRIVEGHLKGTLKLTQTKPDGKDCVRSQQL